jgi:hypothetical protein
VSPSDHDTGTKQSLTCPGPEPDSCGDPLSPLVLARSFALSLLTHDEDGEAAWVMDGDT